MQEITFFNFNDWKCTCSNLTYNKKQIPVFAKRLLVNDKEITWKLLTHKKKHYQHVYISSQKELKAYCFGICTEHMQNYRNLFTKSPQNTRQTQVF